MSELKVNKISPETATSLTVGTSGDTVTVPSGATLDVSNATVNLPATLTVASELKTNKISPASGSTTVTLGDNGDAFTIPSGVTFANSGTATGFGGALTKISTQTPSGVASVEFTSGIDSTYDLYIFKYNLHLSGANAALQFEGSSNTGGAYGVTKTTTFFRAKHNESNSEASLDYQTGYDRAQSTSFQWLSLGANNDADGILSGELYLFAPSSTTYVKHF